MLYLAGKRTLLVLVDLVHLDIHVDIHVVHGTGMETGHLSIDRLLMLHSQSVLLITSCMPANFILLSHLTAFEKGLGVLGLVVWTEICVLFN